MNRFFDHINSRTAISNEEFETIMKLVRVVEFKKKEFIIRPKQLIAHHFFVLHGCLRSFFMDTSGKENTDTFAVEDWYIGDYTSYFLGEQTTLFVECLEDCQLIRIDKENWESLYHKIPNLETYTRINLERSLAATQRKTINNLTLSAKERYLHFRKTYPNLEQRVKNYHIASYLGIAPESLSRVRGDFMRS